MHRRAAPPRNGRRDAPPTRHPSPPPPAARTAERARARRARPAAARGSARAAPPPPGVPPAPPATGDPLHGDDDFHLTLYCLYELHYRGFEGVDDSWEWEPSLIRIRRKLESCFEEALRTELGGGANDGTEQTPSPEQVPDYLKQML